MRWEDERYVKVYTRDTPEWCVLSWEARACFLLLIRAVDRAGMLRLGPAGAKSLAALIRVPVDVVERVLPELEADGCVRVKDGTIIVPNFCEAQEARQSDKARARTARERARASAIDEKEHADAASRGVTGPSQNVTGESRGVTGPSHGVTPNHTASLSAQLSSAQLNQNPPNPPAGGTAPDDFSGGASSAGEDRVPTAAPSTLLRLTPREQAVAAAIADDRSIGPIVADAPALAVKLCARFPGVDLVAEIGKAGDWCRDNQSKPKKSGERYLLNWMKDKDANVAWVVACYLAALKRFARIDRAALDGDHKSAARVVKEAGIQVAHRAARGGGGYMPTLRDAAAHWLKTYITLDDARLAEQGYPLAFMLTRINVGDLPTRPVTAETTGPAPGTHVPRTAPPPDDTPPEDIATPEQIQQLGLGAGFSGGFGNGVTSGATPILQRPRFS